MPSRRTVLAAGSMLAAGCLGTEDDSGPIDAVGTIDLPVEPVTVTLNGHPSATWNQAFADARNAGYVDAAGPRGEATVEWESTFEGDVWPPVIDGDLVLADHHVGGRVYGVAAGDGEIRWEHDEFEQTSWTPAIHDGRAFVADQARDVDGEYTRQLVALDDATGVPEWTAAVWLSSSPDNGPTIPCMWARTPEWSPSMRRQEVTDGPSSWEIT